MLTGSFAMHFYATPRMTRDIDIVIELNEGAAKSLCSALGAEFYADDQMAVQAVRDNSMFNVIFQNAALKVDFVMRKRTEYGKEAFSRKRHMDILGHKVMVSTAEDLILSKLDWAKESESEMQLRDVANLLKVRELDTDYIEVWVKKLELTKIYAKSKTY